MKNKSLVDLVELPLENLDLMSFILVVHLLLSDVLVQGAHVLVQLVPLIVELVLKRQEMLVEGNAVSKEGLITARFVFLIDFPVFEQLDLMLHQHYLLLHVQDILFLEVLR